MDLLETVLRTANAVDHIDKFREEGIEAKNLKLLTDEDLIAFGIEDAETRKEIMHKAEHLQIASEQRVHTKFDNIYVNSVVSQVVQQMLLYNATLTPMALTPNIINVTLPLANACEALSTAIDDLHQEVVIFKQHILKKKGSLKPKKNTTHSCLVPGLLISAFVLTSIFVLKSC